jgi:glucose-1-phosphate adenylyltransferase
MVLAGGNGTRLGPLTAECPKPALPFAEGFRIIDFVLGNLVNSGVRPIYVLAQYKSASIMDHIRTAWSPWSRGLEPVISVVLPETGGMSTGFSGTADAVYQNLHLIRRHQPDLVAVFAADQIYRMDVRQMAHFHQNRGAHVTVAGVRVPIAQGSAFGIMSVGPSGELLEFLEKPERPAPIVDDPDHAYASMGNYLFSPRILEELLEECHMNNHTDFGRHILPLLPCRTGMLTYDFASNLVPGLRHCEEPGYWRDVGTIESYDAAQRDVLGSRPLFDLSNGEWPICGSALRVHAEPRPT